MNMAKTGNKGLKRLINATVYSYKGIRAALEHEEAFRQESLLLIILIPVAIYLADTLAGVLLLISALLLVLLVELLNSAIEAVVDRIGDEHHELSGRAKDMGSAAVTLSILICIGIWAAILI